MRDCRRGQAQSGVLIKSHCNNRICVVPQTEALKLWRQLEQDTGVQLLQENGLLFYGDTDTGMLRVCVQIKGQQWMHSMQKAT